MQISLYNSTQKKRAVIVNNLHSQTVVSESDSYGGGGQILIVSQ